MDAELTRERLERAVLAAMDQASQCAMQWGVDDCSLWCAGVLREVFGYDAGVRFRGRYRTRLGAARALGREGLIGAFESLAKEHGWRMIGEGAEQPGDVGIVTVGKTSTAVICRAPGWFVARALGGFTAIPAKGVKTIWAVI